MTGFEPATSSSRTKRSTKLSHTPKTYTTTLSLFSEKSNLYNSCFFPVFVYNSCIEIKYVSRTPMNKKYTATILAILAAALYAINIPISKILLTQVSPTMMAAFLYLGAGLGLFIYQLLASPKENSEPLTKDDLPYTIGMIVLDIAAPILLMLGLQQTNSANASLLNNFEIVATSLIAFLYLRKLSLKN